MNLKASKTGSKLSSAVSLGSENHDLIGIALSNYEIKNNSLSQIVILKVINTRICSIGSGTIV